MARNRRYPSKTMTEGDYIDDRALLRTSPAQGESKLYCLQQAGGGNSLYMNTNKTEFICFKQEWAVFTLYDRTVKSANRIRQFGSDISSTEIDINICFANALYPLNKFMIIWKTDISDEIKRDIFRVNTTAWMCQYCWMDAPYRG